MAKFSGKLWIGRAGSDARQPGNQIPVFLRDANGNLAQITQPITLNKGNFDQFVKDNAALIANPSHAMALEDSNGQTVFNIPDVSQPGQAAFSQRLAQPAGYQLIGEIPSVDDLRKTRPLFEGAKIKLKSWHPGTGSRRGRVCWQFSTRSGRSGRDFQRRRLSLAPRGG